MAVLNRLLAYDGLVKADKFESTSEGMTRSVVVERIEPGSPAASANLQVGDAITRLGDMTVLCSFDVERALLDHGPRDTLPLVRPPPERQRNQNRIGPASNRTRRRSSLDG